MALAVVLLLAETSDFITFRVKYANYLSKLFDLWDHKKQYKSLAYDVYRLIGDRQCVAPLLRHICLNFIELMCPEESNCNTIVTPSTQNRSRWGGNSFRSHLELFKEYAWCPNGLFWLISYTEGRDILWLLLLRDYKGFKQMKYIGLDFVWLNLQWAVPNGDLEDADRRYMYCQLVQLWVVRFELWAG